MEKIKNAIRLIGTISYEECFNGKKVLQVLITDLSPENTHIFPYDESIYEEIYNIWHFLCCQKIIFL